MRLILQLHHGSAWHDAAELTIDAPERGSAGPSSVSYDVAYFAGHGAEAYAEGHPLVDARAVSVRNPVDLVGRAYPGWPPFVLDLMPQGHARRKLSDHLGLDPDAASTEIHLLLGGAGAPVGNMRIREAAEREADRLRDAPRHGVSREDILGRSEAFQEVADRYAMIASGSSGLQGEWPKIAMARGRDGLWYPDPVVPDQEATGHVIVKLLRSEDRRDRLILAGEAAYAGVAREFGLRVHGGAVHRDGVLVLPRFDRRPTPGGLLRLGQESVVSAIGVSAFGHVESHETYLGMVREVCSDPFAEVLEYLRRDVLNLAMGNPDNHGRNTAIAKDAAGRIALTPLFDFAPMRLSPADRGRPTKWACMRAAGRDHAPDWDAVCEAAAGDALDPARLAAALAADAGRVRALPEAARRHGVPEEVVEFAIGRRAGEIADGLARIRAHRRGIER